MARSSLDTDIIGGIDITGGTTVSVGTDIIGGTDVTGGTDTRCLPLGMAALSLTSPGLRRPPHLPGSRASVSAGGTPGAGRHMTE